MTLKMAASPGVGFGYVPRRLMRSVSPPFETNASVLPMKTGE